MTDNFLYKDLCELLRIDSSIFDFIQEGSLDGLWYWDMENPENEWMNPKFLAVLGYKTDEISHKSGAWETIINQDDLKIATGNFTRLYIDPRYHYDQVVRYTHKNGPVIKIRCRGIAIRDNNGKPLRILGANHIITELSSSEYNLQQNLRFQKIISEISTDFVRASAESFDSDMNEMLARTGKHFQVDRSYIFLFSDDLSTMTNTHEWCNDGVDPQMEKIRNQPSDYLPWWKSQIISNDFVHIPDVEALSEDASAEKNEFRSQDIKSLICLRIKSEDKVWGFFGFDSVKKQHTWNDNDINSLSIAANLIASLLRRLRNTQILLEAKSEVEKSEIKIRWTEEALRQSNFVVENIQIGLYIYHLEDINDDRTLRMKYANPATETMTGVKAVDIIGKTLDENFPYLRDLNFPQRYAEVVRSGKERTFEDIIYGDNRVVNACFSVKAFPLPNNHLGIAFENITEKVAIQQAVEQSNARLKEAQEVGGVGSWEYDMTSGKLMWSEQTYRIYEEEKDSFNVTFENVVAHLPDGDREEVLEAFTKAITERNELCIDHWIISGKGETRYVQEIGKMILSDEGTPLRMVGSVIDITERKKAELKLKEAKADLEERSSQLEAINKELEAFSYSVSHDLRAPLRHIIGYVDLLNQRYLDVLPEKARHFLDTISLASRKMGVLIDDLLQYSRTGRQEVRKTEIDMNHPVKEVIEEISSGICGRKINWDLNKLPIVYADHTLIRQVWANLLGNAVKYTRRKETADIKVVFSEDDRDFVFCVSDNGDGFDMKYVHKLFGVFQRLHSEAEFEGTGIGLANVQRIVHKHMGRVWAGSEPGKGAKFYFTLPKQINE